MPALHLGLAQGDITPPIGVTMAGYAARDKVSESVETPLQARALVAESQGRFVAVVSVDLIGLSPEIVAAVRAQVRDETPIPATSVLLLASHTHWGPEVRPTGYLPRHLNEAISPEYVEDLHRTLAGLIVEAHGNLRPAAAGWGVGLAAGISYSRRPVNVQGSTVMSLELRPEQAAAASATGLELCRAWPAGGHRGPRLSPPLEILQGLRAGVSDPHVPMLKLTDPEGEALCGFISFGCHPVVGGEDNLYAISPDYPEYARRVFQAAVGCPLAFSLGCAGDQVPAWRRGTSRQRVGQSLGAAAVMAWHQIQDVATDVHVATAHRQVALDVVDLPTVAEAERALAATDDPEGPGGARERHLLGLARKFEDRPGIETEMNAFSVGDFAAVCLPGETFAEIGLQIKQQSPFAATAVITLCNDSIGYISTADGHREGGYEPQWSAPGPGAERQVVDTALEMLAELQGVDR